MQQSVLNLNDFEVLNMLGASVYNFIMNPVHDGGTCTPEQYKLLHDMYEEIIDRIGLLTAVEAGKIMQ